MFFSRVVWGDWSEIKKIGSNPCMVDSRLQKTPECSYDVLQEHNPCTWPHIKPLKTYIYNPYKALVCYDHSMK